MDDLKFMLLMRMRLDLLIFFYSISGMNVKLLITSMDETGANVQADK